MFERVDAPELLDLGEGTPDDVRASLRDLWRINRYLGGVRALTKHLYPRLRQHREATLVDIGAGSGEIAVLIARWARRQHLNVRVIAFDFAPRHLTLAREFIKDEPNVYLVQADANALPFNNVDYVISSLFLHHFTPYQSIKLLRAAYSVSRYGLIMSDLVRGWLPLTVFKLIQPIFARSYITRYDGAVSVRRAYNPAELHEMAKMARIPNFKVYEHFPWRMTLVADK